MSDMIRFDLTRVWHWLVALMFWRRQGPPLAQAIPPPDESPREFCAEETVEVPSSPEPIIPVESPNPEDLSPRSRRNRELSIAWHFRSVILDRLTETFICLARLRQHDPDAYRVFSRIGFAVTPDTFVNPKGETGRACILNRDQRLTYGGVFLSSLPNHVMPAFFYFRKLRHPIGVQGTRDDIYELTCLYDERRGPNWQSDFTIPMRCYLAVSPSGDLRLLKTVTTTESRIRPQGKNQMAFMLRQREWRLPQWVLEVADEKKMMPDEWAGGLLRMALATYVEATERIIIRVKKQTDVAAFGIELKRASYFFRDREARALAADGKRKRIFHSVIRHSRRISETHWTDVRAHFRGLRDFDWNGYAVHIVFPDPGLHRFSGAAHEYACATDVPPGMVDEGQFADQFGALAER